MSDVVVTVPKGLWQEWIEEGDLPGDPPSGYQSHFWVSELPTALTVGEPIRGFQGWRYRWWDRADERPFPDWQTAGVR